MSHFPNKNYFTMPNEIFSLGLDAGSEIAVYAYLNAQMSLIQHLSALAEGFTPSAMPLATQRIRSYDTSTRSRRKISSILSRPLS